MDTGEGMEGRIIDCRYQLQAEIGRGGMGVVYEALDLVLGRRVAVKLTRRSLDEHDLLRRRFLREARAMCSLAPSAAVVYSVGLHHGAPYVAMELLDGIDLEAWLEAERPTVLYAVEIGRRLADALAEVHRMGLVHRDLKPSNVFLERTGGTLRIRLLDFGLVKLRETTAAGAEEEPLTAQGATLGTLAYMAPEQIRDASQVDHRADLWSVGVTLYQLFTGELPFRDANSVRLIQKILFAQPAAPSAWQPAVPRALDELILACLHKDRASRPSSIQEVAAALEACEPAMFAECRRCYASRAFIDTQPTSSMAA